MTRHRGIHELDHDHPVGADRNMHEVRPPESANALWIATQQAQRERLPRAC